MATLTKTTAPGLWSTTGVEMTMTASTPAGDSWPASGRMLILAHNTDVGAQTITITSTASPTNGRTGDVTAQSLAADEIRAFIIQPSGWQDGSGNINITTSDAGITIGIMNLP